MPSILHIDASARRTGSVSRALSAQLAQRLAGHTHTVVRRDLADGLPLLDEALIGAYFTPPEDRTPDQRAHLATSDTLVAELAAADAMVIGLPIYNFGVPAALKAWIDLVARAGVTFRYTPNGPVGLLADRPVYLVVASGGTVVDGPVDFATPGLKQALRFLGLEDVRVVDASGLMVRGDAQREAAEAQVAAAAPLARAAA